MRFEARDLKPYIETVEPADLQEGQVYFSISYVDDDMLLPILLSLVFVGKNLEPNDINQYYFQDLSSYSAGIRYDTFSEGDEAIFHIGDMINSIQTFENALDELLVCSLRRKEYSQKSVPRQ